MLKSFFSTILTMFCFLILETAVISNLTFLPAIPDFLLIITLFVALNNGSLLAESTGFVSGIMLDFLSASPLGLNALLRTILGFIAGFFHDVLNATSVLLQIIYGAVATVLKAIIVYLISLFFTGVVSYSLFSQIFLTEVLLNALFTPIIFKFLSLFSDFIIVRPESRL
jgi:rod shape-determining protein MreD